MFCPKCGTQNPDNGKFCRSCGTDLGNVSDALAGRPNNQQKQGFELLNEIDTWNRKKKKPLHWEGAISKLFSGLAFLVVAIVLAVTGAAGAKVWWFWMLIPAFGALGSGIAQIIQLKKLEKSGFINQPDNAQNLFSQTNQSPALSAADFNQLESLISNGNKIEAIKNYRSLTGANLKQAKKAVENIELGKIERPAQITPLEDYSVPPRGSIYDTGELNIPTSVTEGTTRHLEINKEGETMTLPKK